MSKIQNIGYHGTTLENAEKILLEQRFIDSTKNNEWLGRGVYFFAYLNDAEWWVNTGRLKNQKTEIIKADLEYTEKQVLDLDDRQQLQDVDRILRRFVQKQRVQSKLSVNISAEPWDKQICWACNMIKNIFSQIGIIIYTFPSKQSYQYIPFRANQRQICVSEHNIIKRISKKTG